jgi:hypothetical protein
MDFSGICFWITEDQNLRSYHQEYDFLEEEAAREWRSLDIFLSTSLTSNFQNDPLDRLALNFHIYGINLKSDCFFWPDRYTTILPHIKED